MTDRFDIKTAAALDRYTVPEMSADFADRALAKALSVPAAAPASPARRDRRGGWTRIRNVAIGVGAFGLMSAAAAATGAFGDIAKDVPVIGTLIARIAPARPKPAIIAAPKPTRQVKPAAPAPADVKLSEQNLDSTSAGTQDETIQDTWRAQRQAKLSERIDQIQARRAQIGLPPLPENRARRLAKMSLLPPETRQKLEANIADRLHAAEAPGPLDRATKRALIVQETRSAMRQQAKARQLRLRQEWQALSPEERATILQRADERVKRADEAGEAGMITRRKAIIQELRTRRQQQGGNLRTPMPESNATDPAQGKY
jgi:hypothetical protein